MYEALSADWLYDNRSLWSVEADSIRTTLAHFKAIGREQEIYPVVRRVCDSVVSELGETYGDRFSKAYLREHVHELVGQLEAPAGYMYYLCRFAEMGFARMKTIGSELDNLVGLRAR